MIEIFFTAIPIDPFDQQKLETLVRRIPQALVKIERFENGEKRFYSYPKENNAGFKVGCIATHYLHSNLPSDLECNLNITQDIDARQDEHRINFSGRELYHSLSYGTDIKKFNSFERVYGLGLDGRYKKMFRYSFSCDINYCQLTFSTRPADKE